MNRTVADCLPEMCWYLGVFSSSVSPVPSTMGVVKAEGLYLVDGILVVYRSGRADVEAQTRHGCSGNQDCLDFPAGSTVFVSSNHTSYCCASR